MKKNNLYLNMLIVAAAAGTQLLAVACNQEGGESQEQSTLASLQQGSGTAQDSAQQDGAQQDSPAQDETSQDTGGTGSGSETGNDTEDDGSIESDPTLRVYSADLKPVNDQAPVQNAGGTATFQTVGGQFTATVNATGLPPNTPQIQHIHEGPRCPTPDDDTNGDGWVDAVEEGRISGDILVPLDNDLNQQVAGLGPVPSPSPGASPSSVRMFQVLTPSPQPSPGVSPAPSPTPTATPSPAAGDLADYPTSDANGAYNYSQTANLAQMLADLRAPDPDPRDEITKLEGNEALAPSLRVIIVHGVPPTTQLPPTVRSILGLPAYLTVPVACGEINVGSIRPAPSPGASPSPSPAP